MKIKILKNLTLTALVALCIVQTTMLWLENFSFRSLFADFLTQEVTESEAESLAKLVAPYRIITGIDGRFEIIYNGLNISAQKSACDSLIEQLLRNGDFVKSEPLDFAVLIERPCVIYDYAFAMPSDAFVMHFKQKSSLLTGRVKQFDSIVITPDESGTDNISVYFINEANNESYEYVLTKTEANVDILKIIRDNAVTENRLFYTYAEGVFMAKWPSDGFAYDTVVFYNPYGELTRAAVESKIVSFFDKPSTMSYRVLNDAYTFNDDKTVVSYSPNNVLEYASYITISNETLKSFTASFNLALNMIARDKTLGGEIYLSGYSEGQSGYTFWFNCAVNNFPLFFSRELIAATGMNDMIEVSISKKGAKYLRYIAAFEINKKSGYAVMDFYNALSVTGIELNQESNEEQVISDSQTTVNVNDVCLGYRIDGSYELFLYWSVNIDGFPLFVQAAD